MVAVTFGVARVAETKAGKARKNIFVRAFDAIAVSQMKRAERELARYRHLLTHDFDVHARLWSRDEEGPIGGW